VPLKEPLPGEEDDFEIEFSDDEEDDENNDVQDP
jgi:hypothetical protein